VAPFVIGGGEERVPPSPRRKREKGRRNRIMSTSAGKGQPLTSKRERQFPRAGGEEGGRTPASHPFSDERGEVL